MTKRAPPLLPRPGAPLAGGGPVLGIETPPMRDDDLAGDVEAEPGILAETFARPVGIEALEDALQILRRHAGPLVLDRDLDLGCPRGAPTP